MKKIRRVLIITLLALIVIGSSFFALYKLLVDENALSIIEKKWIDENNSNVISLSIPNDLPVFGNTGAGVFFDFSKYLTDNLGLKINNNTVSYLSDTTGYGFKVTENYEKDSLLMFKDHFVLISKNSGVVSSDEVSSLNPGVLSKNKNLVATYYSVDENSLKSYDQISKIIEDLGNGNLTYALVPLNEYKDQIIENNINILYHVSDLNKYYYFSLSDNGMINNIFKKEFNSWMKKQFTYAYNKNNYKLFVDKLGLTEVEEDTLTNTVYKYGFAEYKPYEVITSGEYGGITSSVLKDFSAFSGVEFSYKKYRTPTSLAEAAIKGDIDLYYNYYNLITNYIDTGAVKKINYYVIAHNDIDLSLTNISGLDNQIVYALENSYLSDILKNRKDIKVITYKNNTELNRIVKKKAILIVDEAEYNYYITNKTNNYTVRLSGTMETNNYSFRYKNTTDPFYKLFNAYTKTLDPSDLTRKGISSYNYVAKKSVIVGTIAKYSIIIIIILSYVFVAKHKKEKAIKINTKVKKEDRIKYIDLLTSLKNRNYYNEKVNLWNKNTIYPQACIVLDINGVKILNDSYGHEEGDKLIQGVANALIKTQIDNSEIMRTDGNEFFVYLVGYPEKQVVSYIKKLIKEFNKLNYKPGVAIGFSMIEDDTKLVEDAFNEASIKMRSNKEEYNEKKV